MSNTIRLNSIQIITAIILLAATLICESISAQDILDEQQDVLDNLNVFSEQPFSDGIVAIVNDDVVVASTLRERIRRRTLEIESRGVMVPRESILHAQVLDEIIVERLQIQLAKLNGIEVSNEEINESITRIAEQSGMDVLEFRDALESDGFSLAKFRDDIRNEMIMARVRRRFIDDKLVITPSEIDYFIANQDIKNEKKIRLKHILIADREAVEGAEVEDAMAKARRVITKIKRGEDIGVLAKQYSDGINAENGGNLGWLTPSELPELFRGVIEKLTKGQVSAPIKSPNGVHIFYLDELESDDSHMVTQTKARHVLVKTNELVSDEDAKAKLRRIKRRLENNEPFSELARSHSEDMASAMEGGVLGWLSPGDTVPEFERMLNETSIGEVSEPFQTQFGWHILQILDVRKKDDSENMQRNVAEHKIRIRKQKEELQNWLLKLREEAYVEVRL